MNIEKTDRRNTGVKKRIGSICALLILLLQSALCLANDDFLAGPKFGYEFTFAVNEPTYHVLDFTQQVKTHLVDNQPEGAKFQYMEMNRTFSSPEGWNFVIGTDPEVFEVTGSPHTVAQFRSFSSNMQDAIFVSAYNKNYFPGLYLGGGHINIDVRYFLDHPILLRNFLVDFVNHVELSMGIFNYDTNNATPLVFSPFYEAFVKVISDFDLKVPSLLQDPSSEKNADAVQALLTDLNTRLPQTPKPDHLKWEGKSGNLGKYSAISFSEAVQRTPAARIEIRSVRAQWSMDVWVRQISLFKNRLLYLHKTYGEQLIPIDPKPLMLPPQDGNHRLIYDPPIDPEMALKNFYFYVEESGESWWDHRDYMWPGWMWRQKGQDQTVLERFEASRWFLTREGFKRSRRLNSCVPVLK